MSATLSSVDLAVLALLAGVFLMYFEANCPGAIVPGCAGLLTVLLSLHRMAGFTLDPQGVALLLAGLLLLLVGIVQPARGLSALLAAAACSAGLWRLFALPYRPHLAVAVFAGVLFACVSQRLGRMALMARRLKRRGGLFAGFGSRDAERARLNTHLSARKGVS